MQLQLQFNGFIIVGLGTTTLGSINYKSSFGQFQNAIYLAHSQVKRHGKVFFQVYVFFEVFFSTPYSQANYQYLIHQFASHFS
jgi:hypothetical protein